MPAGGSDCCETCWFNSKNKGEAGIDHRSDPEPDHCSIRDLDIEEPLYTYCGNHPYRRSERDAIPIGPVFMGDSLGNREIWRPSPDTEAVRRHLLDLAAKVQEQPAREYPIGVPGDEIVVWQLGEFRESRAIDALRRIVAFDPEARSPGDLGRTRRWLVDLAREALAKIAPGAK